jgi:hypothetical protein
VCALIVSVKRFCDFAFVRLLGRFCVCSVVRAVNRYCVIQFELQLGTPTKPRISRINLRGLQ